MGRPLLFLDVDGPLIPFGGPPDWYPAYQEPAAGNPLLARVNPAHGPRLQKLGCELVWATAWEHHANSYVGPILGLPELDVVTWPEPSIVEAVYDEDLGLHWKTRALVRWAEGRPFAWIDDELTEADQDWVADNYPEDALLHRVNSVVGLRDTDYVTLSRWLSECGG
ncbi:MAG: hypothetical protein FWE35_06885 [Streptosporangiales bacterium]|nr:hypothetical protein [Streptosporangiales bacterium]